MRAEPETALPCLIRNKHYVENYAKVNTGREFRKISSLLVLTEWKNFSVGCEKF